MKYLSTMEVGSWRGVSVEHAESRDVDFYMHWHNICTNSSPCCSEHGHKEHFHRRFIVAKSTAPRPPLSFFADRSLTELNRFDNVDVIPAAVPPQLLDQFLIATEMKFKYAWLGLYFFVVYIFYNVIYYYEHNVEDRVTFEVFDWDDSPGRACLWVFLILAFGVPGFTALHVFVYRCVVVVAVKNYDCWLADGCVVGTLSCWGRLS